MSVRRYVEDASHSRFPSGPDACFGITRWSVLWPFARDRGCCVVSGSSFLIRELQIVFRQELGSIPTLAQQYINGLK